MTAVSRYLVGATAYTRPDFYPTHSLEPDWLSAFGVNATTSWDELINHLLDIRNLTDDWDGQGAVAPPAALVDGALTLAQHFRDRGRRPADRVLPGVNGTVYFEWYLPDGYLEVEVDEPDHAGGRFVRKGSDKTEVFALTRGS